MSQTDLKDINDIVEWAKDNEDYGNKIEIDNSCFSQLNDHNYLEEYCFENIPEMRAYLSKMWQKEPYMKSILNKCCSIAFRKMPRETIVRERREENEIILSDSRYMF